MYSYCTLQQINYLCINFFPNNCIQSKKTQSYSTKNKQANKMQFFQLFLTKLSCVFKDFILTAAKMAESLKYAFNQYFLLKCFGNYHIFLVSKSFSLEIFSIEAMSCMWQNRNYEFIFYHINMQPSKSVKGATK